MAKITVDTKNINFPAPKVWRKIENAMLIAIIPAIVLVLTNWGFKDEILLNRVLLLINVLLAALIKAIGLILADDQEKKYIADNLMADDGPGGSNPPPDPDDK